jgi:cobalt/nickel transport system ATP-binding protein
MNDNASVVEVENLSYRYHDGTKALRGVNFHINKGERVCLAGPNGAGKSTLLLCLAGLLKAEGKIAVTQRAQPNTYPFGLVFQNADDQLFCPLVGEDVAFGPRNQKKPENEIAVLVDQSLAAVGLSGFEKRSTHHLSGGEKKRAAIAALLACQPEILALDEPWANLDARACHAVTKILHDFEGTLVISSHDLRRAQAICHRFIIMDGGTVVADGPAKDVLTDVALLEAHGLEIS